MRPPLGLPVLAALALGAVGCGPALDEPAAFPAAAYDFDLPAEAPAQASAPADDDIPPPAPRLRRTKTLGESTYDRAPAAAAAPGAPAQGGTTVVINNNIQQNTATVVYGAPVLPHGATRGGWGASRPSTQRGSASSPPPVGGDWPKVPSYGPR